MSFDNLQESSASCGFLLGIGKGSNSLSQVKPERTRDLYKVWDMDFGEVYSSRLQWLPMIGEVSFLWSGLVEKSELRQLLDDLYEEALAGSTDSRESSQILEEAYYQK